MLRKTLPHFMSCELGDFFSMICLPRFSGPAQARPLDPFLSSLALWRRDLEVPRSRTLSLRKRTLDHRKAVLLEGRLF